MDEKNSKKKGLFWIGVAFATAFIGVIGVPWLARQVPWSWEVKVASYLPEPDSAPCNESGQNPILNKIVSRVFPQFPEDSKIPLNLAFLSGKTVNAFASLGGKIYLYNGLLQKAESAEEIAGVLAHEIEHMRNRHIIQGVFLRLIVFGFSDAGIIDKLINLRFSREQEAEADAGAIQRLISADVDAMAFQRFFERMGKSTEIPAFLSDHPASSERAARINEIHQKSFTPILDANEWQQLKSSCFR